MTEYRHVCNGQCGERIDRLSDLVVQLKAELKAEKERNAVLEGEVEYQRHKWLAYNFREDANWDGGFRAEISE